MLGWSGTCDAQLHHGWGKGAWPALPRLRGGKKRESGAASVAVGRGLMRGSVRRKRPLLLWPLRWRSGSSARRRRRRPCLRNNAAGREEASPWLPRQLPAFVEQSRIVGLLLAAASAPVGTSKHLDPQQLLLGASRPPGNGFPRTAGGQVRN